ncbi:GGDEF domain-containing protein [Inhella gelatinilytica]|uniref:diguanylate cyclase n=1 Tax=Inhella gelatinilytica TaxID=2795030 RepID=A0A931IXK5_9BURK|nr:GGDEF domain-containing protein [Inhella gelatinilytica]MBH9552493.1 GGDEF domain-containing protein [Inhella gelatinilytica]
MSELVDHLATVMRVRDMEQLDRALVVLLGDTLSPRELGVSVRAAADSQTDWTLRAQWHGAGGDGTPSAVSAPCPAGLQGLVAEAARTQRWQQGEPTEAGTWAAFPLFNDWDGQGVLWLRTTSPWSARRLKRLFSLLRFYGNFRDLVSENERDTLTGLLNRKTFDAGFARVAMATTFSPLDASGAEADQRGASGDAPCWLVVSDIDHFKRVNDQFGHLIGDEVLLLSARLMRQSFRFSDKVFRFGGEEFVLMLHNAEPEGARRALEKFRERMQSHEFPQVGHVTVSLGYTRIQPDDTPDSAFERADKAVYVAKQEGRNRVCCFEDLVRAGRLPAPEKTGSVDFF